jgi:predicted HAD superfamily Cof-like phosphohydrolase
MSKDWVKDISLMHRKYATNVAVRRMDKETLKEFLWFRLKFLDEELQETLNAVESGDPEEVVDGLIDLCVVAIGTLDVFKIDAYKAWDEVLKANMKKIIGVKKERPNPLGLPDLIKPDGWTPPSHEENHGNIPNDI